MVVDGPFAEAKDVVGGYSIIEAKDPRTPSSLDGLPDLAIGGDARGPSRAEDVSDVTGGACPHEDMAPFRREAAKLFVGSRGARRTAPACGDGSRTRSSALETWKVHEFRRRTLCVAHARGEEPRHRRGPPGTGARRRSTSLPSRPRSSCQRSTTSCA